MALVTMKSLLENASKYKYAVGYFEAFNMDSMVAIVNAAEKAKSPVIIGFGGSFLSSKKRDKKENIYCYGALGLEIARRCDIPVALMLNEADEIAEIIKGMHAGFNAVMYQKEGEDLHETICINKKLVQYAHYLGIDVEAEVGNLPTANIETGIISQGQMTDPDIARNFIDETGIDALAVAIGNIHLLEGNKSSLNFDLLRQLRETIHVPLVLHGGTGIDPDELKEAIELGISKVNIGTVIKRSYIKALKTAFLEKDFNKTDPHSIIGWGGKDDIICKGQQAIMDVTTDFINILGSGGMAGNF